MAIGKQQPKKQRSTKSTMKSRRPRRTAMKIKNTGSFASRNETSSLAVTAGIVYDVNNINITQFPACTALAKYYQYYRITSIRWRLKPNYDTFVAPAAGGNPQLPYLYFLFDKAGSLGNMAANQFEECGAIPQRVDDKMLVRTWRPSVITSTSATTTTQFKTSPWLPTYQTDGQTPNVINHLGAVFYVSKMNNQDGQSYDVDLTVTFQFRKPLVIAANPPQQTISLMSTIKDVTAQAEDQPIE